WRHGLDHLAVSDIEGVVHPIELPCTEYSDLCVVGATVHAIAASPAEEAAVIAVPVGGGGPSVLRPPPDLRLDRADVAPPRPASYATTGGRTAHALYYAPASAPPAGPPTPPPPP